VQDGYLNRWYLDPLFRGAYPQDMVERYEAAYGPFDVVEEGDLELISAPVDFLGINYYNPMRARAVPGSVPLELELIEGRPPLTSMGWEVEPDGLRQTVRRIRDDYRDLPICITENGAAYPDGDDPVEDAERTSYVERHLAALEQAIAEGVNVERYFLWSLLDNFEWEHGYEQRFGIVHVDFETQARTPKRSALSYSDHIARVRGEGG
jgi:beta-glucosidase